MTDDVQFIESVGSDEFAGRFFCVVLVGWQVAGEASATDPAMARMLSSARAQKQVEEWRRLVALWDAHLEAEL